MGQRSGAAERGTGHGLNLALPRRLCGLRASFTPAAGRRVDEQLPLPTSLNHCSRPIRLSWASPSRCSCLLEQARVPFLRFEPPATSRGACGPSNGRRPPSAATDPSSAPLANWSRRLRDTTGNGNRDLDTILINCARNRRFRPQAAEGCSHKTRSKPPRTVTVACGLSASGPRYRGSNPCLPATPPSPSPSEHLAPSRGLVLRWLIRPGRGRYELDTLRTRMPFPSHPA
jgi:hypothetical protein